MEDISIPGTLYFHGPFKFTPGDNSLFASEFAKSEGVYIWTIKDEVKNLNLVEYVGQTPSFANRQKHHLIQILSLNYRIINAKSARQGKLDILWPGLWRMKNADAISALLEKYGEISNEVKEYLGLINIFFAPTLVNENLRCHIEGSIGWNLRNNYPDKILFYPADNHIGARKEKYNKIVTVTCEEPIEGIPGVLEL